MKKSVEAFWTESFELEAKHGCELFSRSMSGYPEAKSVTNGQVAESQQADMAKDFRSYFDKKSAQLN